MSYDKKYRECVLAHVESGKTQEEVRKMFGLGANTITQWKKLREETGDLENRELERKPKKIDPEKLREYFAKKPEACRFPPGRFVKGVKGRFYEKLTNSAL